MFEQELFKHADLVLAWTGPTCYSNALDRVALVQALITWGRTATRPVIRVGPSAVTKRDLLEALKCDELLVAVALATTVQRANGSDATGVARDMLRKELTRRQAITDTDEHRTLVLSTLEHRINFSPDVMTRSPAGDTTDWTTRTMFHRVDIASLSSAEQKRLLSSGEEIHNGPRRGAWLRRSTWPADHPLAATDSVVTTIGQRLLRPTPAMVADWESQFSWDTTPADWLGQALWELFQNTEHHALKSAEVPIPRALRALFATPVYAKDLAADDASPLAQFVRRHTHRAFLSVSVIDSGDGLAYTAAARRNLKWLDPATELIYFRRAVNGEARSPERPLHGFGMPIVGHLLTAMKGFIQIRSGSIVLHRDFGHNEFTSTVRDSTTDWAFDIDAATDPHRRWGTVATIVLPRYGQHDEQ